MYFVSRVSQSCSFLSAPLQRLYWSLRALLTDDYSVLLPLMYIFFGPRLLFTFLLPSNNLFTNNCIYGFIVFCNFYVLLLPFTVFSNSALGMFLASMRKNAALKLSYAKHSMTSRMATPSLCVQRAFYDVSDANTNVNDFFMAFFELWDRNRSHCYKSSGKSRELFSASVFLWILLHFDGWSSGNVSGRVHVRPLCVWLSGYEAYRQEKLLDLIK